jgi:hypothetical protein
MVAPFMALCVLIIEDNLEFAEFISLLQHPELAA